MTLRRPARHPARRAPAVTASGSIAGAGGPARVAAASRIWVEGRHDAELLEHVWGDDLRDVGIVVEPMHGIDDLAAAVAEFAPSPQRRLGVLVDHLVAGSKEAAPGGRRPRPATCWSRATRSSTCGPASGRGCSGSTPGRRSRAACRGRRACAGRSAPTRRASGPGCATGCGPTPTSRPSSSAPSSASSTSSARPDGVRHRNRRWRRCPHDRAAVVFLAQPPGPVSVRVMAQAVTRGPVSGTGHVSKKRKPFLLDLYSTAVGKKYVMAITGLIGIGFVIVHMIGNLKVYLGLVDARRRAGLRHRRLRRVPPRAARAAAAAHVLPVGPAARAHRRSRSCTSTPPTR